MGTRGNHCTQLRMQWQLREQTGKWKPMSDRRTRYQNPPNVRVQRRDNGREAKGQWSPKVKARIREHEAERLWDRRSAGTWAEKFHSREGAGRKELGEAILLRGLGWRMHESVEDTKLSTNKQHSLS
jgi:hypothetical protein